jgi:hypothetical protein
MTTDTIIFLNIINVLFVAPGPVTESEDCTLTKSITWPELTMDIKYNI